MLEKICKLARDTGHLIMNFYLHKKLIKIFYKTDNTPVTNVDYEANNIIKKTLLLITPNIPIISEEDSDNISSYYNYQDYWLIDPLDGTKEFLNNNGDFTVNISLVKNNIPVIGVIYAPFFDFLYFSMYQKAWKEIHGIRKKIQAVNSTPPLVVVSRSHFDKKTDNYLNNLGKHTVKKIGSSLKFCYIADGQAQIYPRFGNTSIWDTAAGHAIVIASGGIVKTWTEKELTYKLSSSFINPGFCARAQ
ncbi:3'(2'),5'-bisphosphate nucleotidase CysQ [Buchnera aphidicola]|uniref:3'(2'),5'-bisphosphate nucleotidase CysQ n=1 Tax=Buchnera aphidicola TaxID=9 RepID=UPI0034640066